MAGVGESRLPRDGGDVPARCRQEMPSLANAKRADVIGHRRSDVTSKCARDVDRMQADIARERLEADRVVKIRVEYRLDPGDPCRHFSFARALDHGGDEVSRDARDVFLLPKCALQDEAAANDVDVFRPPPRVWSDRPR